jgi:hypothetical protein
MSLGCTKIDKRDNITYIYELKKLKKKEKKVEECAFGAVGIYCNCQMKALYPLYETFILLGLLEEAPRRNMRRHYPLLAKIT